MPAWGGARYVNLYPGIDLELTGEQGELVPRLAVRPGANLGAVRLRVEGADAVAVDGDVLRLSTAAGDAIWPLLRAEGMTAEVAIEPAGSLAFDVSAPFSPASSHRQSAIASPESPIQNPKSCADLVYGTFLGGSDMNDNGGIAVDGSGAAYVIGQTRSSDFPTTPGAFDTTFNGGYEGDAFVVKLSADGSDLDYATFLGGSGSDEGFRIAVDGSGAAYVTGFTKSDDFPTTPGAFDTIYNGGLDYGDGFLVKLNAAGSALDYATFVGGSGADYGYAIAVDGSGAAYVTGWTASSDLPTTPGAFDTTYNDTGDAFVMKLNVAGSALQYGTFLGGSAAEYPGGIAMDESGAAYVTGRTKSHDFPTTPNAFDTTHNSTDADDDAFVAKLNAAGSTLDYATFLGGGDNENGAGIAVDSSGAAYVAGATLSHDFPTTPGAFDTALNGPYSVDVFVSKLNAVGSALDYSTFLGGSNHDWGQGIALDGSGMAYVTGQTMSSDFPTTCGAFDTTYNGGQYQGDGFVIKLSVAGSAVDYATFLGGSSDDRDYRVAADGSGAAYLAGVTYSSDFPTTPGAFDTTHNGSSEVFVAKLAMRGICVYLPVMLRSH